MNKTHFKRVNDEVPGLLVGSRAAIPPECDQSRPAIERDLDQ